MSHLFEVFCNATSPVATAVTLKDDSYQRRQLSIPFFKVCGLSSLPGIKRSSVHIQMTTDFGNISMTFLNDSFHGRIDVSYSLRPKIANAFFNMSLSRSTRRRSASRSLTFASSELATGPLFSSCSCFQRYKTLAFEMPNRSTT